MSDTAVGFRILGIGILAVLAVVFAITVRAGGPARPRPNRRPACTCRRRAALPVIMSVGAALLGAGLIFRPEEPYALPVLDIISGTMQPLLGLPGLAVLLYGVWGMGASRGPRVARDGGRSPSRRTGTLTGT